MSPYMHREQLSRTDGLTDRCGNCGYKREDHDLCDCTNCRIDGDERFNCPDGMGEWREETQADRDAGWMKAEGR